MTSGKKLVVIDGKSVFYRGYYAMPNLRTVDGTPTGGIYGFAAMALEVIRKLKPDYVAVAWDKPKTNIRKRLEMYPEYKAGRKPAPADFYAQIPVLHELLDAFGWPLYELDDYEADDIMGSLAVQASAQGIETLLVTSDLDMLQLINGKVKIYVLKTGLTNIDLYSTESFEAKYGIKASQFLDLKALKGDSSDNIPGVPGIGEKGAIELLKEYKDLDGVYANLELVKSSLKQKLIDGKKLAYLSKELARIWTDAPIKLDLNQVDGSKIKVNELESLLERLQFRSILSKLPEVISGYTPRTGASAKVKPLSGKNVLINSDQKLKELKLPKSDHYLVFSRSAAAHGSKPKILIISSMEGDVYVFDIPKLNQLLLVDTIQQINNIIGFNLKGTLEVLIDLGLRKLPTVTHDILVGAFLINSLSGETTFNQLATQFAGYSGSSLEDMDEEEVVIRAPLLISIIKAIYEVQSRDLAQLKEVEKLAKETEWPLIPTLAKMEKTGIELDVKYLKEFNKKLEKSISKLEQEIHSQAKSDFNISSPIQLAHVLFDPNKLALPTKGIKKTKTGFSTAASELDKLVGIHPIIELISSYREVIKLKNTYVDTLPTQVDENSRLHTTFNMTTAQTGRLSSLNPNLQNIPIRTELGKNIRRAFIAGKGKILISADYSQFELRLAAVLAKSKKLIDLFNDGADIHTATAAEVYNRSPEDVTDQMRRAAKVINFGILYGMSPHGLMVATGMTFEQAQDFITKYKELRKPLFDYMSSVITETRKLGYAETMFGRRRYLPDINSSNFVLRQAAERAAINVPVQGTAADLVKMAMVNVDRALEKLHNDCQMLLQIHDSILVECPLEISQSVAKILKTEMENVYDLPVKLVVDVSKGQNWGEL